MDLGLTNKRVVVTGASRGIGSAIAEGFLNEGAKVCIVSRGSKKLFEVESSFEKEFGFEFVFACKCDCTQPEALLELSDRINKRWKGIDIVVANVGDGRSVPDPLPDNMQWKKTWDNNFESALHTARVFLPMLKASKGCLLFISSITALEAFGAPVDYSTAKSAVVALAKNLARKLGQDLRVNVIAPGNVYFEGGSWDEIMKKDSKRIENILSSTVPMNRFGKPNEIADAALFLCSDRAKFITGTVLVVDGGQTVGIF
jgi:3-oxoacyl-[acyl-carrier protein] reductase